MNEKTKSIVKLVEHFQHSVFGEQMETWSPKSTTHHHLIINRLNKVLDEMGYNLDEIPEDLKEQVDFYMQSKGVANWQHDTMNLWEAFKLFAEIVTEPTMAKNLAPGIFFYHRYVTGGAYSLDDMTKTFKDIEPLGKRVIDIHKQVIQEYKQKKLEWKDDK